MAGDTLKELITTVGEKLSEAEVGLSGGASRLHGRLRKSLRISSSIKTGMSTMLIWLSCEMTMALTSLAELYHGWIQIDDLTCNFSTDLE